MKSGFEYSPRYKRNQENLWWETTVCGGQEYNKQTSLLHIILIILGLFIISYEGLIGQIPKIFSLSKILLPFLQNFILSFPNTNLIFY
jgi:hypothetical protein